MKKVNLQEIIEIAAEHHSTKLTINKVRPNDTVSNAVPVVIHDCVPSVINKLKDAGFMLSMCEDGLHVSDLFVPSIMGDQEP